MEGIEKDSSSNHVEKSTDELDIPVISHFEESDHFINVLKNYITGTASMESESIIIITVDNNPIKDTSKDDEAVFHELTSIVNIVLYLFFSFFILLFTSKTTFLVLILTYFFNC